MFGHPSSNERLSSLYGTFGSDCWCGRRVSSRRESCHWVALEMIRGPLKINWKISSERFLHRPNNERPLSLGEIKTATALQYHPRQTWPRSLSKSDTTWNQIVEIETVVYFWFVWTTTLIYKFSSKFILNYEKSTNLFWIMKKVLFTIQ